MPDSVRRVGMLERLQSLKGFRLFSELLPEQLTTLAEAASEVFFKKRAVIMAPGAELRQVHLIIDGRVRVTLPARDGKPRQISLGSGAGVGLLEMLARSEAAPSAVAETETLTLMLDREALFDVLEDEFAIWKNLLSAMAAPLMVEAAHGGLETPEPAETSGSESARQPGRDLDFAEQVLFLRRVFGFAEGSVVTLIDLARSSTEVRFAEGEVVWTAGDRSDSFVVVARGELACVPPEGSPFRAARHHPAGLLEALTGGPRWYTATASTATQGLSIPGSALLDAFEDNTDVAMAFMGTLAERLLASDAWEHVRADSPLSRRSA